MKLSEHRFKLITACLALCFTTVLCYINTWWNGFVFDDHGYIEQNSAVIGPFDAAKIFHSAYPPEAPDQGLYRPLLVLSFKLDQALWGFPGPADSFNGFHLTNTLMHLACVLLVFALLRRLDFRGLTSFCAALLFAIHPVLTESVAWTVGRAEIGAALFTLVALHLLMTRQAWPRLFAPAAWLAAMLFKENAAIAPILLVILRFYRPAAFPRVSRKQWAGISALAVAAFGAYVWLRAGALPALTPQTTPFLAFTSALARLTTAIAMLWKYLVWTFLPWPLSVYHEISPALVSDFRFWLALLAWGALVYALWRWRERTRDWRFALLWWLAALLPISNLLLPIGTVFAERFLYLPCILLYAVLAETARRRLARTPIAGIVVLCAVAGILFGVTVNRNADWRSDLSLWDSALKHYPDSFVVAGPYASALSKAGRYEEALSYVKKSEAGLSAAPDAYRKIFGPKLELLHNEVQLGLDRERCRKEMARGRQLVLAGQPKKARELFEGMARKYPQLSDPEEAIADVYARLGNDMAAIQHYQKAILIEPEHAILFGKMAQSLAHLGDRNHAIEMYERSWILDPNDPRTNYNLAVLWNDLGQTDKAIYYMEKAVGAESKFTAARLNLASFYRTKGREDDAISQLREVLRVDPQNPEAHKLLRKVTKGRQESS